MRAVARRVGVSHQALSHHFVDRTGLLTAVACEGFAELAAELDVAVASARTTGVVGDPVTAIGVGYAGFAARDRGVFELMFADDAVNAADPGLVAARLDVWRRLSDAVDEAVEQGWGGGEEPTLLAAALWASAHGVAMLMPGPINVISPAISAESVLGRLAAAIRDGGTTG